MWAYNTLMFGAYTRADRPIGQIYDHPGTTARLAVLREVAAELGVTANQVVLAWLLADGVVPIVGVSTMAQLDEAIGAADVKLDADVLARLNAAVNPYQHAIRDLSVPARSAGRCARRSTHSVAGVVTASTTDHRGPLRILKIDGRPFGVLIAVRRIQRMSPLPVSPTPSRLWTIAGTEENTN
ncbi:aldo/keto reductase [Luedemannella flava]